jgi:hypothetical protein
MILLPTDPSNEFIIFSDVYDMVRAHKCIKVKELKRIARFYRKEISGSMIDRLLKKRNDIFIQRSGVVTVVPLT